MVWEPVAMEKRVVLIFHSTVELPGHSKLDLLNGIERGYAAHRTTWLITNLKPRGAWWLCVSLHVTQNWSRELNTNLTT